MRRHERVKYDPNEKFEMVSLLPITLVSIFTWQGLLRMWTSC